jgi:hypothetical protein
MLSLASVTLYNCQNIFIGETKGKGPLERPRPRFKDNIRMDLRDIGWEGVEWIDVAQDRTSGGLL